MLKTAVPGLRCSSPVEAARGGGSGARAERAAAGSPYATFAGIDEAGLQSSVFQAPAVRAA